MTAKDLSTQVGISAASIATKTRRMGYTGIGQNGELPQDVIDYYLPNAGHQQSDVKEVATVEVMEVATPKEIKPVIKAALEKIEPKQTKVNKAETIPMPPIEKSEPFDPGAWLFFHPAARFAFVCILLGLQAYIFASLAERELPGKFGQYTWWGFYIGGFVIGTAGVMIAKNFKKIFGDLVASDTKLVNLWLAVFFLFDLAIDYSYLFTTTKSITFGGVMIGLALPLGILAHSANYTKD